MNAISISNLRKVYKGGVVALDGIDLEIKKGDFFGLLGPNGAGKTTIIGILTGLVDKTEGEVKIFNHNIETDHNAAKMKMGVVPQEINLYHWDKVLDIVINQAGYYGIPRKKALVKTEKILKKLALWEKRNALVMQLSGGMKRRLMIAKALVHDPSLLILDEPTAGVDAELRANTWEQLRELNKKGLTILLTTHYLEEAESLCKHIAIMDKGVLFTQGSTKSIIKMTNQETFILDLNKNVKTLTHKKFPITILDKNTIEVTIAKEQDLNEFFDFLNKKHLKVLSMRNKQNRLEKFFLEVIRGGKK